MQKLQHWMKKIVAVLITTITCIFLWVPYSKADDSGFLAAIYQNTNVLIEKANTSITSINKILEALLAFSMSWLNPDKTEATSSLQSVFASLNNAYLTNTQNTFDVQAPLLNDFFGSPLRIDYANDLSYSSLWGKPYVKETREGVDSAYNYVKNASGLNIEHVLPGSAPQWKGSQTDIDKYRKYYQTIAAVQTFNTFVLSQSYVNQKNGYQFTLAQLELIKQASDAKSWFATIASEDIGIVLRQILMYNSQIYLALTQLLQTQQQVLTAQSMTNTLLIMGNQFTENQLLGKASGRVGV